MKKILIIDTAGKLTDKIEAAVPATDFKLFISNDYSEGNRIALIYRPDVILLCCDKENYLYPNIKKFCDDEVLANIPLIILAEEFSEEEQRAVMDLGADDYITGSSLENSLQVSIRKRLSKLELIRQNVNASINTFDGENGEYDNDDHILIKIGNKLKLIEFSEIACITALKEYSKIITKDNCKIIIRKSLKAWVELLPAKTFLRIHRATIININYIEEIKRTNDRTYTVHLKNMKETFDFSYRYANIMRHTFPT